MEHAQLLAINAKIGTTQVEHAHHALMDGPSTQANAKSQRQETQVLTQTAIKLIQQVNAHIASSDGT